MDKRLELHEKLCAIINITESDGDRHVYFQPPASVLMNFPAIRYSLNNIESVLANNGLYGNRPSYQMNLIDKKPNSEYVDKILQLPYCRFNRHYKADNLNHFEFTIYNV